MSESAPSHQHLSQAVVYACLLMVFSGCLVFHYQMLYEEQISGLTFSLEQLAQADEQVKYWLHGSVFLLLYPLLHNIRLLYWKYKNDPALYEKAALERLSIITIVVFSFWFYWNYPQKLVALSEAQVGWIFYTVGFLLLHLAFHYKTSIQQGINRYKKRYWNGLSFLSLLVMLIFCYNWQSLKDLDNYAFHFLTNVLLVILVTMEVVFLFLFDSDPSEKMIEHLSSRMYFQANTVSLLALFLSIGPPDHLSSDAIVLLLIFLGCTLAKVACANYLADHSSNDPTQPIQQQSRDDILDDSTF